METFLSNSSENENIRANSMPNAVSAPDSWIGLQRYTSARIAIGRTGGSQRTPSILDFRLAHARARDAVHATFNPEELAKKFAEAGFESVILHTPIRDKQTYLMNPDMGRVLDEDSKKKLREFAKNWKGRDFAVIVSDGLSATAANLNAVDTVKALAEFLPEREWAMTPIIIVPFARVKIQDAIGEEIGIRHAIVLIGERPGLGSPDSLSAYFTYKPVWNTVESDRNCVSNIRPLGMPPRLAAKKLAMLLKESLSLGISGTALKDNIDGSQLLDESKDKKLM